MLEFARALPGLRRAAADDLGMSELTRPRVLACAVRLLDLGFFRIGTEGYAEENQTYGLATIHKEHVTLQGDTVTFDYPSKTGKPRVQSVVDPQVAEVVRALKRRRGGGPELLAYKHDRRWVDVKSPDINAYIKEITGEDFSAKDFRTWGATVLAAVALAVSPARDTTTARKRAVTRAVKEVAHSIGNTPAVARASYIDPRVFDRYRDGIVIAVHDLEHEPEGTAIQGEVEDAVLDLVTGNGYRDAPGLDRVERIAA